MNREEKTIFVSILTVLLLGLSNYLNTGKLIFTFPINDFLMFGIACYVSWFNFRKYKGAHWLLLTFLLFHLFAQLYNWELFLNQQQLSHLSDSIWTDVFQLFSSLIFLVMFALYLRSVRKPYLLLLIIPVSALFIFAEWQSDQFFNWLSYLVCFLVMSVLLKMGQKKFYTIYLLFVLFIFLYSTKIYTLYCA